MILSLFIIGMIGGSMVPLQTSINNKLSVYTRSPIYTSTISFGIGMLFLLLLNAFTNPHTLTIRFLSEQSFDYYWFAGGMIGVVFLTGNLLLLPRLGASLTVVISLTGQIIMGVIIDMFGWFDAPVQPLTIYNIFGVTLLIMGIVLMNYAKRNPQQKVSISFYLWMLTGFIIGFGPPVQTAINSKLGQAIHSTLMASLVSFTVGFIVLLLIKTVLNTSFKLETKDETHGKLKPIYFIGGTLGVVYITANIFLMPYLGAALTTVAGMLGQMIIALIIDHFGLLGIYERKITPRKLVSIMIILIGILLLRLF